MREFDDKDRERGWESDERDWAERNRSFMFGERDLGRREPEQGFADRDRGMRQYGRAHDHGGFTGDRERISRHFSSRQDDHYLSWRDKQIDALDRDYADYCREREQQFHEEFDAWRRRRRTNPEPLQTGMMQTGQSSDISGTLELSSAQEVQPQPQPDPVDTATLGTTSTGRRM
jgi:hypothetical protein